MARRLSADLAPDETVTDSQSGVNGYPVEVVPTSAVIVLETILTEFILYVYC